MVAAFRETFQLLLLEARRHSDHTNESCPVTQVSFDPCRSVSECQLSTVT